MVRYALPGDTIVKLRVLSRNQQLIRMDFEALLDDYADESFLQYAIILSLNTMWCS